MLCPFLLFLQRSCNIMKAIYIRLLAPIGLYIPPKPLHSRSLFSHYKLFRLFKIRRLLWMLCAFCFLGVTQAQGVWEAKQDLPLGRKEIADAITVLDGKIYVLGGIDANGNISNTFDCYDPQSDSWTSLTPYPLAVWRSSLEAIDGKIYGMGGYQTLSPFPFSPTNKAYVYDPQSNSWSPIKDLLLPRGSAASVVLDDGIHLIGGANNSALDDHHRYDPANDEWSVLATMKQSRSGLTAAVFDGQIFAMGGYILSGGVVSLSSAEVFGPNANLWNDLATMPFPKLGISAAFTQGRLYVFGNENNRNVLEYRPTTNAWSERGPMPEDVNFAGAVALGDLLYVVGGGKTNLTPDGIDAVHCFKPDPISAIRQPSVLPITLLQLSPNPSFGNLLLTLVLDQSIEYATISIFDRSGRELAQLFEGPLKEGKTVFSWNDMDHLTPGIYVVQLRSGTMSASQSLVVE